MQLFHYKQPFELENGAVLPELTIGYHTYGKLNADRSNVVWVCHALTASSDALDWWSGVTGAGKVIDPARYFIICANILSSCYGSSGPLTIDPNTNEPYFSRFPIVTIRDMVRAHMLLRQHLQLDQIYMLAGGSMGGYQALEWCAMDGTGIENLLLLATSATESAWGVAAHTAQRLAIEADPTWKDASPKAGQKGLKAARAIGLLTYRNYDILVQKQSETDPEKLDNYKASSYINYQGDKLVNRFNAYSYWLLTKAMDSHHLARGRNKDLPEVLQGIKQRTMVVGITSDILCPLDEQHFLAGHIPNASMVEIDSAYGHDGFMVEAEKIAYYVQDWLGS